jgi:signal peptidase II
VNSRLSWRIIALSGASAMLSLDQLTKHWALASLGAVGARIELAGPFNLTLVLNRSNASGLIPLYGEGLRWALTALGVAAAVILLCCALRRSTSPPNALGLALICAGALGNALDRLRSGAVVDLFDASKLGFVWVFNVADVSIDLGVALILVASLVPLSGSRNVEHSS